MRILFDTNVILDVLLDRRPFAEAASYLFDAVHNQQIVGFLAATTLTTVEYLVARARDRATARQGIAWLLKGLMWRL